MKKKGEGAWIFVSHSHKDIDKVRFIRNEFEKRGHNPLLFFLKCLDDEAELDDLIKREITERNWFILCDSPNARASKWVQDEVEMIKSLEGKVFETIDVNDDIEIQIEKITNFSKRSTVFLSYTMKDKEIGDKIIEKLKKYDFGVFEYKNLNPIISWQDSMYSAIDDVLKKGFFLILISEETFKSRYVLMELVYALQKNANVVPIFVDDKFLDKSYLQSLLNIFLRSHDNETNMEPKYTIKQIIDTLLNARQGYVLDKNNLDESLEILVKELKEWEDNAK